MNPPPWVPFHAPTPMPKPGTHVLIIGVGDYPNSKKPGAHSTAAAAFGAYPLDSPPLSARAMADWFFSEFHNPAAPLASVDLLLSDSRSKSYRVPGTQADCIIPCADFTNISAAFSAWHDRCDSDLNNLAVFYFCGHGVEGQNRVLIPSDFPVLNEASRPNFTRLINFDATLQGMAYCRAKHQFYLLDSCRTVAPAPLKEYPLGVALTDPDLEKPQHVRAQPVFTVPAGTAAFGRHTQVSAVTNLLLHALSGAGARDSGGLWRVSGESLVDGCRAVKRVFVDEALAYPTPGLADFPYGPLAVIMNESLIEDPVLHHFRNNRPPLVPTRISCAAEAAVGAAFSRLNGQSAAIPLDRHPRRHYGYASLETGSHCFRVDFPAGGWVGRDTLQHVRPPVCECDVEVQRV